MATLVTPSILPDLQRKLYERAKKEPKVRRIARWWARKHHQRRTEWSLTRGECSGARRSAAGTTHDSFVPHLQGAPRERRGKLYAGNPHVRFDGRPLARASCTAGWGRPDP